MRKISAVFVVLFMTVALCGVTMAAEFAQDYESWRAYTLSQVQALIEAGANVSAKCVNGATPLMYASGYSGDPEIIRALIRAGADVNAQYGFDGGTPLIYATRNGNLEIVNILILAGADVNAKDHEGKTALTYAENIGDPDILNALK